MSEPADVYAGNVGAVIPVSVRTDDDGNKVQAVDVARVPLNYDTAVVLGALDDASTHIFGSMADSVVIYADQAAGVFDGTLRLETLRADGSWGNVPDGAIIINGFTASTPNNWSVEPEAPRVARRDGVLQMRLRVSVYNSGSVTVTFSDLPSASRVSGSHDGNNFQDNVGVFIDNYHPVPVFAKGVNNSGSSTLAVDGDEYPVIDSEDITIQIEGDSDGTFTPQFRASQDASWKAISLGLFTDITAGGHPVALVNGGVYTLDIFGLVPNFRIVLGGATTGSSVVSIGARVAAQAQPDDD